MLQNNVSAERSDLRGVYHSTAGEMTRRRTGSENGLQHHPDDVDIAQLFVQGFDLLDMGCVDGDRN